MVLAPALWWRLLGLWGFILPRSGLLEVRWSGSAIGLQAADDMDGATAARCGFPRPWVVRRLPVAAAQIRAARATVAEVRRAAVCDGVGGASAAMFSCLQSRVVRWPRGVVVQFVRLCDCKAAPWWPEVFELDGDVRGFAAMMVCCCGGSGGVQRGRGALAIWWRSWAMAPSSAGGWRVLGGSIRRRGCSFLCE